MQWEKKKLLCKKVFFLPLHPLIIFKKLLYNAFISLFTQKNEGVT